MPTNSWHSIPKKRFARFYGDFFGKGDIVFDIGATDGAMTAAYLNMGVKVIALEPQDQYTASLQQLQTTNKGLFLLTNAVSSFVGTMPVEATKSFVTRQEYDDWEIHHTFSSKAPEDTTKLQAVSIVSLDYLVEQYGCPAFCRIQTDGEEIETLRGLNYAIPALSFNFYSYNPKRTTELIRRLLAIGDYEFNWCQEFTLNFQSDAWLSAKELHYSIVEKQGKYLSGDIYARLKSFF